MGRTDYRIGGAIRCATASADHVGLVPGRELEQFTGELIAKGADMALDLRSTDVLQRLGLGAKPQAQVR